MPLTKPLARRVAIAALAVALLALPAAVALAAPADLDPGFGQNGRVMLDESELARALVLQPDGRILVAGDLPAIAPDPRHGVVYRLNPSGALDPTFAVGGARRLSEMSGGAHGLALQPDGKVLVAGYTASDAIVYRLHPSGLPDETFGQYGMSVIDSGGYERAHVLALQPDGKLLVAGLMYSPTASDLDPVVYRRNANGTPDGGFGQGGAFRIEGGGSEGLTALALQPDGKVLVAGATTANGNTDAIVYRLNANGTLDDGFAQGGRFAISEGGAEYATALVRQPDGRILVVGDTSTSDGNTGDAFVYRLHANGTLDPTFGQGGRLRIDDGPINAASAAALAPDGKVLLAGLTAADGDSDAVVYRLNRDGSLDPAFDGDGARPIEGGGDFAQALAVQQDGRIVVAGGSISALSQKAVVYRLQGGDPAPTSGPAVASARPRAPVLARLRISPSAFRAAAAGPSALPAGRRGGGLVSFTLDRAASVRFSVERAGRGRRVGGHCVKPTRSNRGKRRCTRYSTLAGGFTRRGAAGANRFRFTGRLIARRLRTASYRLIAAPSAEGRRGVAKRARFRVKR